MEACPIPEGREIEVSHLGITLARRTESKDQEPKDQTQGKDQATKKEETLKGLLKRNHLDVRNPTHKDVNT